MRIILRWQLLALLVSPLWVPAQAPPTPSSVTLFNDLQDLNFLGSALYIAAHPDDENTNLISYLSNAVHARTAYLSLTRGDGGQNLIGPELRELLGVLRTQELLAARRIDGGAQFFTRAVDFGYSKHPEETLSIWDKDLVLSDVVRIIRTFRPDVIVNRFDHRTPGSTHGHHTSSAILSVEAFDLAGDANAYPEQLDQLEPWQPKRVFHNTSWWFYGSRDRFLEAMAEKDMAVLDVGVYYPERGLSNNEIASIASSQHLCQGFGRPRSRGSREEFLELIKGSPLSGNDLFEGIDTSWNRLPGGAAVGEILESVEESFNFADPAVHLPDLLKAYNLLEKLESSYWKKLKIQELRKLIAGVSGLYMEASSEAAIAVPGETATVTLELLNRSEHSIRLRNVALDSGTQIDSAFTLDPNIRYELNLDLRIPEDQSWTSPYWLRKPGSLGTYQIPSAELIGKPETPVAFHADVTLVLNGTSISYSLPVIHRYSEPDKGERYRDFEILPPVTAAFEETVRIFSNAHGQSLRVRVKSNAEQVSGTLGLEVPEGWVVTPAAYSFTLEGKGVEGEYQFEVLPPENASEGFITPRIASGGAVYDKELITISYDHTPTQSVLMPARVKVVRLNVQKEGQHIGYIMGAGDALPANLEAIGYTVHPLKVSELTDERLNSMDAVVMGIRAYNVLDELPFKTPLLLDYVRNGGTLVVQYNTSGRGERDFSQFSPYPLRLSRDRVSNEEAEVRLLAKSHPILTFPNQIRPSDFDGWIQERGLYFPNQWDSAFIPILSMNDPGEPPRDGSLLVANYGKGYYIYTGLSFFRELPAGVPGAFKLFANMLSIGKAQRDSDLEIKG